MYTCESIHEGGQRPVQHLEERVPAGVPLGSTKHRVLQDVRDARVVQGGRSELDTETQKRGIGCFFWSDSLSWREKETLPFQRDCTENTRRPEEVVGVVSGCVEVLSSGLIVGQLHCCDEQVRDPDNLRGTDTESNLETMTS